MAFVPDQAIDRSHEIPGAAFRLYCYYCKRRDGETGVCWPSLKLSAADLSMAYTYASEMRAKLISEGWIEMLDNGQIRCLVGFGKTETPSEKPKPPSEFPKNNSEKPKINSEIPKPQPVEISEKPKPVSEKPKNSFGNSEMHIGITSPMNQPNEPAQRREAAVAPVPPSSPPNLDDLAEAVSTVTGIRPSGWRIDGEIRMAAIELHGQGFTAAEVLDVAKRAGKVYRVKFCAGDLASDRARLANAAHSPPENSRAAHQQRATELARQKLFGGGSNGRQ